MAFSFFLHTFVERTTDETMRHTYPEIYHTYAWLVDLIRRKGNISLREINERWVESDLSDGTPMHRNTFRQHLDAIHDMLGIDIVPNTKGRGCTYSIASHTSSHQRALNQWALSSLKVATILKEARNIQHRILLEEIPAGDHLLTEVTHAMELSVRLHISYQKFLDAEPYETLVEPYCIKLFHQRWYLLGHRPDRDYLAVYAFDRMQWAHLTDEPFTLPQDFDAAEHFAHLFGVFQAGKNEEMKRITLRTYEGEWNYLRTLPLHWSQKEKKGQPEDDFVDFTVEIVPTLDFLFELLSHGSHIEILTPVALRQQMAEMVQQLSARYSDNLNNH